MTSVSSMDLAADAPATETKERQKIVGKRAAQVRGDKGQVVVGKSVPAQTVLAVYGAKSDEIAKACVKHSGTGVVARMMQAAGGSTALIKPLDVAIHSAAASAFKLLEQRVVYEDKTRPVDFVYVDKLPEKDRAKGQVGLFAKNKTVVHAGSRMLLEKPLVFVPNTGMRDGRDVQLILALQTMSLIETQFNVPFVKDFGPFLVAAQKLFAGLGMGMARSVLKNDSLNATTETLVSALLSDAETIERHKLWASLKDADRNYSEAHKTLAFLLDKAVAPAVEAKGKEGKAAMALGADEALAMMILNIQAHPRESMPPALAKWLASHGLLRIGADAAKTLGVDAFTLQTGTHRSEFINRWANVLIAYMAVAPVCQMYTKSVLLATCVTDQGLAIYPRISVANHSCMPNCNLLFGQDGTAALFSSREIAPGEEITIAYDDDLLERWHEHLELYSIGRNRRRTAQLKKNRETKDSKDAKDGKTPTAAATDGEEEQWQMDKDVDFDCVCSYCKNLREIDTERGGDMQDTGLLSGLEEFPAIKSELLDHYASLHEHMHDPSSYGLALDKASMILDILWNYAIMSNDMEEMASLLDSMRLEGDSKAAGAAVVAATTGAPTAAGTTALDADGDSDMTKKARAAKTTETKETKETKDADVEMKVGQESKEVKKDSGIDDKTKMEMREKQKRQQAACFRAFKRNSFYLARKVAVLVLQLLSHEPDAKEQETNGNGNEFSQVRAVQALEVLNVRHERKEFKTNRCDLVRNGVISLAINCILSQWVPRGFKPSALRNCKVIRNATRHLRDTDNPADAYKRNEFVYLQPYLDHYGYLLLATKNAKFTENICLWIAGQTLENPDQALFLTAEHVGGGGTAVPP